MGVPPPASPDFAALFGRPPECAAEAPGRVNLIGEHTDYNGGFVLPAAIRQTTRVELAHRRDDLVQVWSDARPRDGVRRFTLGGERREGDWTDYVQGVTWALAQEGRRLGGLDLRVTSTIPVGSGLSSSAALEMSLVQAIGVAFGLALDAIAMARVGRRAENEWVGVPTGVMDQMASLLAGVGAALFLDTRTLSFERVKMPAAVELVVIASGVHRDLSRGDYRTRKAECEEACRRLGVTELRDVGPDDLARVSALPEPLGRRARHVITENRRVLEAVAAMKSGEVARLGRLFGESHASMRDDYEVSVPAIDRLVGLAGEEPGIAGARLTGGGFGGSIVALAAAGRGAEAARRIVERYAEASGHRAMVLVPEPPRLSPLDRPPAA